MPETDQISIISAAIQARPRKAYPFDVSGFFGLGGNSIHRIAIRVNTKKEQDSAIITAHARIHREADGEAQTARGDNDLLTDAKTIEALFSACRRCEDGDEGLGYKYPAFPGPGWMREHITTDQLAVLLNLYNEVRKHESPYWEPLSVDQVEALATICALKFDTDVPEAVLSPFDREYMTQAFVLLAKRWRDASVGRHEGDEGDASERAEEARPDGADHVEGGEEGSAGGEDGGDGPVL